MIIEGRVSKVEVKSGTNESTGNQWRRVEFEVEFKEYETDRAYDKVRLEDFHDSVIDNIAEGMLVCCVIGHTVEEYNGRRYNRIRTWEVKCIKKAPAVINNEFEAAAAAVHDRATQANIPSAEEAEDPDDLPF